MNMASSILVLGRDFLLLNTRASVLRQAGYRVEAASSLEEAHDCEPDLLILCHSLPGDERVMTLRSSAANSPATHRLCMTPAKGAWDGLTETFNSFEGPAMLVQKVQKMLNRPQIH